MIDAVCRSRLTSNISSRVMLADTYAPDDDGDDDDDDDGTLGVTRPAALRAFSRGTEPAASRFPGERGIPECRSSSGDSVEAAS